MQLRDLVQSIINGWDPIDLLPHFPPDEYEEEVLQIIDTLNQTDDVVVLGNRIESIFKGAFGDTFNRNSLECLRIAQQLIEHMNK